jgi:hypothetical protein
MFAYPIERALRKTYHALMQSVRAMSLNVEQTRSEELNSNKYKVEEVGTSFEASPSKAIADAAQHGLRLNLTHAGMPSGTPVKSGASRTQAPSRPRRLHFVSPSFFVPLYTAASRKW